MIRPLPTQMHGWLGKNSCIIITREKVFYSSLDMTGITDAEYKHAERV